MGKIQRNNTQEGPDTWLAESTASLSLPTSQGWVDAPVG